MSETNEALGRDIVEAAVLRGSFRLRSGAQSSYYIDKYLFTTRPDLLRRIAAELALRMPMGVQRVAGPVLRCCGCWWWSTASRVAARHLPPRACPTRRSSRSPSWGFDELLAISY